MTEQQNENKAGSPDAVKSIRRPEVRNNKEEVPMEHYLEVFRTIDPAARAKELGISFEENAFSLEMYHTAYKVAWPDGEVTSPDPKAIAVTNAYAKILLLRYLMEGKSLPTTGAFRTFRELPWGEVYIKPFTGRCIMRLAFKFGKNLEGFRKGAEALGGVEIGQSDAGYEFAFLGEYRIRVLLWQGDEEFPPSSQFLYTDNFAAGFSAEDCVVAAETLINAITAKLK